MMSVVALVEPWTVSTLRALIPRVVEKVRTDTYLSEVFEFYDFVNPLTDNDFGRVSIDKFYSYGHAGAEQNNISELRRHLTNHSGKVRVAVRSDFGIDQSTDTANFTNIWFRFNFADVNAAKVAYFPNIKFITYSLVIGGLDASMSSDRFTDTVMNNIVKKVEANNEIEKFRAIRKTLASLRDAINKY